MARLFSLGFIHTTMHYNVIFDITQTKFHQWSGLVGGFIFIAFAACMYWFPRRGVKQAGLSFIYSAFIALFFCVLTFMPFYMFFDSYRNYQNIKTAMEQSRCDVAEGTVTNLHPLYRIKSGGAGETFSVDGKVFSYRQGSVQNGFHQVGIIHDGLQVRIFYYDWHDNHNKDIARLEIAP